MASIRTREGQRGTTHSVLYRRGGKQTSETFTDLGKAEAWVALIDRVGVETALRALDSYDLAGSRTPTLAEQIEHHIEHQSGVGDGTRADYRRIGKLVAGSAIGPLPIDAITRDDVAAWVRGQERGGVASKTIRNRHSLVSAALTRAVEDGLITRNPAHRIKILRTERQEMVVLTPPEFAKVLAQAPEHYRPFLMAAFGTGLRFGELIALRVQDLHLDDKPPTLTVARAWKHGGGYGPPKTARGRRTIAIPTPLVAALRPVIEDRKPDDLVFTNLTGERIRKDTLWRSWKLWIAKAQIGKDPRFHDLRHSHASWMIAQGITLHDLRQRLGHESIQTTSDVYGHMMPEAQAQAERAAALAFAALAPPVIQEPDTDALPEIER